MLRAAALVALLAAPACAPPDEPGTGALVQAVLPDCPKEECGNGNSPVVAGVYFWMLHSDGLVNDEGVGIIGVTRSDGVAMRLIANGDQLLGVDPVTGVPLAVGTGLVNTRITVAVKGVPYQIRFRYVSPTWATDEAFWVGSQARVEAYDLVYTPMVGPPQRDRPLCSAARDDLGSPLIRAVAFTGDNYDPTTKKITLGPATAGWMNIACKWGARYKMHLIGHTTAAATRLAIPTSLAKRRAVLNAWTMNACGTGQAFTVQGTHITLTESQFLLPPTSPYQAAPSHPEAIWTQDGAVCLDYHRLATSDDDAAAIKKEIEIACGHLIPACGPLLPFWNVAGQVVTGAP